jgi:hypothetical protein
MTPTLRTGFLAKRYGEWCPVTSFNLKALSQEYDVLQDFGYFSNLQAIEKRWEAVHMDKSLDAKALINIERDLKRDWWYCTMLLHLQYLCACYSLVAKLCSNRNIQVHLCMFHTLKPFAHARLFTNLQAWNFFFDKQKQTKNEFFVQTWGSRPQKSIITHEGDLVEDTKTHKTLVKFDIDSFSTVAAVTNVKPLNPSSAFEIPFRTRRFMYYEVTIESEPDAKSMLQIGWTIASRERNGDEVSDDNGAGDFPHSWGFDGIRSISYTDAEHLLESYNTTIEEQHANLATLIPSAKDLNLDKDLILDKDLKETQIQDILKNRRSQIERREDSKEVETAIRNKVETAIYLLRSRISLRRNIIAQMEGAENLWKKSVENITPQPSFDEECKKSLNVNRGLLCFHSCIPGLADCSVAYLSDELEKNLNSENPISYRWKKTSVIGVWFDADSLTMGIVRSVDKGGKQILFSKSETEFFDDKNSVTWKEADIVPCISGRGVDIKINLGISEGVGNDFKFLDEERIVFRNSNDLQTSPFEIKSVKNRIFKFKFRIFKEKIS